MADAKDFRLAKPPHPGGFLRTEVIDPLDLSVTAAAAALGVTRSTLSGLLNEQTRLTSDMALRMEKAFGVPMETLLRMQGSYDIATARKRESAIQVQRYVHPAVTQPKQKSRRAG